MLWLLPSAWPSFSMTCSICPSRRSPPWWADLRPRARQLASRARRRVKGAEVPAPDPDLARQRAVVDAFFRAARSGEFDVLVALLHPDVVLRADFGPRRPAASTVVHGAAAVARQARLGANPAAEIYPALVNGAAGVVITMGGRPHVVMAFTVATLLVAMAGSTWRSCGAEVVRVSGFESRPLGDGTSARPC